MSEENDNSLICVGVITSAHGIKGAVNIKAYTQNPRDINSYGTLYGQDGKREYKLKILSVKKDQLIAIVDDLDTRNDAEKLKGLKLFIRRSSLPEISDEDEFYSEDLIGLKVILEDGNEFGEVTAVQNYGSCDILEIKRNDSDQTELVAFTKDLIPEVNVAAGYLVLCLPEVEFVGVNDNNEPDEGQDS